MLAARPGFRPDHRIAVRVALPQARSTTAAARAAFFSRLLAQTRALPGVESASLGGGVPPNTGLIFGTIEIEGKPPAPGAGPSAFSGGPVAPGFFRTLGIRVLEGREFTGADRASSSVIVNQSAARRWWPGQSAMGKRLRFGASFSWMTVIAVVSDIKTQGSFGDIQVYQLLTPDETETDATLVAATSGDPAALAGALKGQVWSIDPGVPITEISTLEQAMAETLSRPRFNVVLLSAFAAIGLLLAA